MKRNGSQTILQGAIILTASTLIVKVIGAMFKIPLANILGGVGMSYFVSAYDVLIPIYSMTVTGLGVSTSRVISESTGRGELSENILKTARTLFLVIGLSGAALLFFGAPFLTKLIGNPSAELAVCCIAPSVLFSCMSSAYRGYFQGMHNMLPTARSQILEAAVKLFAGILLAWLIFTGLTDAVAAGTLGWQGTAQEVQLRILQLSAAGAVMGVSISTLCGFLFIRWQYRKSSVMGRGRFSGTDARRLWRIALPIALTSLCANLTTVIDLSSVMNCLKNAVRQGGAEILQMYKGAVPPEVTMDVLPEYLYGSYSGLATSIYNLVPAVTVGIGVSAIPAVAGYCAAGDDHHLQRSVESVMATTAAAAFPAGFGIFTFAKEILVFLYPHQLMEASIVAPTLRMMGLVSILIAFSGILNNILQASGMEKTPLVALFIGGLLKMTANFILVSQPVVNIHGIAYGSLLCYSFIVLYDAFRWHCSGRPFARSSILLKPMISAGICCVTARLTYRLLFEQLGNGVSLVLAIAAGGAIYIGMLFLLNFIKSAKICLSFSGKNRRK